MPARHWRSTSTASSLRRPSGRRPCSLVRPWSSGGSPARTPTSGAATPAMGLFLRPLQWMIHEAAACGLVFRSKLSQLDDRFYASLPRDSLGETGLGSYYLTQGFKRFDRTVTLGDDSRQTLDYTVLERWLWDPTYENPSLVGILGSKPERRSRSFRLDDREIESELGWVLAASPTSGFNCPSNPNVVLEERS